MTTLEIIFFVIIFLWLFRLNAVARQPDNEELIEEIKDRVIEEIKPDTNSGYYEDQ